LPVTSFLINNNKTHKLRLKCETKYNQYKNWTKLKNVKFGLEIFLGFKPRFFSKQFSSPDLIPLTVCEGILCPACLV